MKVTFRLSAPPNPAEERCGVCDRVWLSQESLTNPDYVMLSEAKHLYCGVEDSSVAAERSLRVT
jgi:hypothetical protein